MGPAQQYGIKIAQPGYDVRTCKDYNLIFNSSWPSLAIVYDQTMSVTTDQFGNAIVAHNLGFPPLSMAWNFTDNTFSLTNGRVFPSVDKNNFYLPELQANTTYYYNIKAYNLDITQPQNYTYLQPPAVNNTYDPTYGIKVVKQNQGITSSDMRAYILHSRCASPQVLSVVTDKVPYNASTGIGYNNGVLTYTNPQGYTPWAFAYALVNNIFTNTQIYQWAPPVSQSYPILLFNGGNYGSGGQQGLLTMNVLQISPTAVNGSIIVLRDPLFVANSVQAVY